MEKDHNVWFCINLLRKPERKKENCLPTNLVWADLDACPPSEVNPPPQCTMETSPGRYQGIWRLTETLDPFIAESLSKRVAYAHSDNGADPSGWDLTQLLRVPLTKNLKYTSGKSPPKVQLLSSAEVLIEPQMFDILEAPEPETIDLTHPLPDVQELPDPQAVIYKYSQEIRRGPFFDLHTTEPGKDDDWSKILWRLINVCLEAGMTREETFAVVNTSACNKYARDGRNPSYLWREVLKAESQQARISLITSTFKPVTMPELVTAQDIKGLDTTLVDEYLGWAKDATDAVECYHELSAFMLMSSVIASGLKLETSYGTMIPNLWGLVLGDSTLTRKTTAMRMALDFVVDIEREMVLATDGSAEGLLTGLSTRPGRTSIFFKDEVSGFMDAIKRKDYLAGMLETLTQLYDVPPIYTRRLRKDTITITNPVFIFYGGGIRDKMYSLLTDEHILSGFLPRFLIVSGDADLSKIRTTGPRAKSLDERRAAIAQRIQDLYHIYNRDVDIEITGGIKLSTTAQVDAELTNDAWERYGDIELSMVTVASESPVSMYALPTFERLSRSLLKMSCLVAATEREPVEDVLEVQESDVIHAAKYIQDWGRYTVDMIQNVGKGTTQRAMDKILNAITKEDGITRSKLMQMYHMTSREANEIIGSLEDRGQITKERAGNGYRLFAVR